MAKELGHGGARDTVDAHAGPAASSLLPGSRNLAQHGHHAELLQQGRVERNLVDAVDDVARGCGRYWPLTGLTCTRIVSLRRAFADQRRDGGIAGVAAVPIGLAVDLDSLKHQLAGRQRRAGPQAVNLNIAENVPGPVCTLVAVTNSFSGAWRLA